MLRKAYTTDCRFFKDSDTTLRIRWYKCLPTAPDLGVESAISPLGWMKFPWLHKGVGEVFPGTYGKRKNTPIPAATGEHVCGTPSDFSEGAHYDPTLPPTIYRPDGLPICCAPMPGGLVLGGSAPAVNPAGGVSLGGSAYVIHRPLVPSTGGLVLGGSWQPARFCASYTMNIFFTTNVVTETGPGSGVWTGGTFTLTNDTTAYPVVSWSLTDSATGTEYRVANWDGTGAVSLDLFSGVGPIHATGFTNCL